MTNQVVQFDTSALQKKVKDHIQGSFGMLIPEDQFQTMVDEAVKEFFETTTSFQVVRRRKEVPGSSYHSRYEEWNELDVKITPFKALVWQVVHELTLEKLKFYFDQEKENVKSSIVDLMNPELEGAISKNIAFLASVMQDRQQAMLVSQALSMFSGNLHNAFLNAGIHNIPPVHVPFPE